MTADFLTPVIVSTTLGLLTALSARLRHQTVGATDIYRFPGYLGWMGLAGSIGCSYGIAAMIHDHVIGTAVACAIGFAIMLCFTVYMFHFRAIATDTLLTIGTFHRANIAFSDIIGTELRRGARSRELVIHVRDGRRIRVSGMLADFDDFEGAIRTRMTGPQTGRRELEELRDRADHTKSIVFGTLAWLIGLGFLLLLWLLSRSF